MVEIGGVRRTGPATSSVVRRASSGGRFAVEATRSEAMAHAEGAAPVALSAMLALQEDAGEPPADRAARRHGKALLDLLAALQHEMLGGDGGDLARLATLAQAVPRAADPALAAVVDAVVLRARVELARRGG